MKNITLFFAVLIFVFLGCEGPMGPPGPEGNATVEVYVYSNFLWTPLDDGFEAGFICEGITSDIYNYGMVLGFVGLGGIETMLPYSITTAGFVENVSMFYSPLQGNDANVILYAEADDGYTTIHDEIVDLKIVVVHGTIGAKKELTYKDIIYHYDIEYIYVD